MKNKKENNNHWGELAMSFTSGLFKKLSFDLVLGFKEQWDKFMLRTKSEIFAGIFIFLGLIFMMVGLAIFIENVFGEFPGVGFIFVGFIFILAGWLASLIRKMI